MMQAWQRFRVGLLVLFWPALTPVWYVRHVFSGKPADRNVLIVAAGGLVSIFALCGVFFAEGWWRLILPAVGLPVYLRLMVVQSKQVLDLQKNPLRPDEIEGTGAPEGGAHGSACAHGHPTAHDRGQA